MKSQADVIIKNNNILTNLIQKYNIPGPRYTIYQTVHFWFSFGIAL